MFCSNSVFAQYDTLLNQPFYKQITVLKKLHDGISKTDSTASKELKDFYSFVDNHTDLGLQLEAEILKNYANWRQETQSLSAVGSALQKIAKEAEQNNLWKTEIQAYSCLATLYWKEQQYTALFETYYTIERILKASKKTLASKADKRDYALLATMSYMAIGRSNYFFKDYKRALYYLNKTLRYKIEPYYIYPKLHAWNVLGLTYYELGELDQSSKYYH